MCSLPGTVRGENDLHFTAEEMEAGRHWDPKDPLLPGEDSILQAP